MQQTQPTRTRLTFMGMSGPQLHHGQVAGCGGAEGEVRREGHWAPVGRGRWSHPTGHETAQEGLACGEKGPVRQLVKFLPSPNPSPITGRTGLGQHSYSQKEPRKAVQPAARPPGPQHPEEGFVHPTPSEGGHHS